MNLTDIQCKHAKPKDKNYKLRDGRGLYLYVMKSGGRSWRYDYKIKRDDMTTKNGTCVFGLYPETTLLEARDLHKHAHKLVSNGIDPNEYKKQHEQHQRQQRAMTFELIANEWIEKRRYETKERTINDIQKRLNNDVFPEIGQLPINEIDAPTILMMLRKIENRGAYEMANRARQYCSQIFRYAIACGKTDRDYTADIKDAMAIRKVTHQPALPSKEIPKFLEALERNDARLYQQTRLALKMLLLTFVRPMELASAEWREIDFSEKRWTIPAEKTKMQKKHIVPLAQQTLEILHELKKINGNRQYVFVKQTNPKGHMNRDTLSKAVRSLGFQGEHTAHGFRALALTTLQEKLGYPFEVADCQLGHGKKGSLGAAYDRTEWVDERTTMMQAWADYIDSVSNRRVP